MGYLREGEAVQGLEVSAAVCCWCGEGLKRAKQGGVWGVWGCWGAGCWRRQMAWSVVRGGRLVFCPVPKQVAFFEATLEAPRVLFGGAAGPGKSYALRWGLYRDALRVENLNCLLLRRTYRELEQTHLREMAREVGGLGGRYVVGERSVKFGNGSVIQAGHCENEADAGQYLSTEYDRVVFDELVTFPMGVALEIMSRARTSKAAVMAGGGAQVWAGSNPGGRGAAWVKAFFVDRAVDPEEFPGYLPERYRYVEARLWDNPYVDPAYRQTLEELPRLRRRQLLEGDWSCFEGMFFDWQASKDGRPWHVADLGVTA